MEIIIPIPHIAFHIVKVGDGSYIPSEKEVTAVRDWYENHKTDWPSNFTKLEKEFPFKLTLEYFPKVNVKNKYVMLVETESGYYTEEDKQNITKIVQDCLNKETDHVLFVTLVSVKRLNKNLVLFL